MARRAITDPHPWPVGNPGLAVDGSAAGSPGRSPRSGRIRPTTSSPGRSKASWRSSTGTATWSRRRSCCTRSATPTAAGSGWCATGRGCRRWSSRTATRAPRTGGWPSSPPTPCGSRTTRRSATPSATTPTSIPAATAWPPGPPRTGTCATATSCPGTASAQPAAAPRGLGTRPRKRPPRPAAAKGTEPATRRDTRVMTLPARRETSPRSSTRLRITSAALLVDSGRQTLRVLLRGPVPSVRHGGCPRW
jgi:hypothetical protein